MVFKLIFTQVAQNIVVKDTRSQKRKDVKSSQGYGIRAFYPTFRRLLQTSR